jgi:hypothetical protein
MMMSPILWAICLLLYCSPAAASPQDTTDEVSVRRADLNLRLACPYPFNATLLYNLSLSLASDLNSVEVTVDSDRGRMVRRKITDYTNTEEHFMHLSQNTHYKVCLNLKWSNNSKTFCEVSSNSHHLNNLPPSDHACSLRTAPRSMGPQG